MQINRAPKHWFSEDIHSMKRLLQRSEKSQRTYRNQNDYEIFKTDPNKCMYNYALKSEKTINNTQNVLQSKGFTKKRYMYQFVKALTGSMSVIPMLTVEDKEVSLISLLTILWIKIKNTIVSGRFR